jgi:hypothetical protein
MTIREMMEMFNKSNPAHQFASLNKNMNAISSIIENSGVNRLTQIMAKRQSGIEAIAKQSAITNLTAITKAFEANNLTGLSNTVKAIAEMNKAMAPTIAGLAQIQMATAKSMEPFLTATRSILVSNEFQTTIQKIMSSDVTRGLVAFNKYAESVNWNEDRLKHLFEEHYADNEKISEVPENHTNVIQAVFVVLAMLTGQDFSTLMDEKKRNIFLAQLMYLSVTFSSSQNICNHQNSLISQTEITKVVCVANRGCVIRTGPGYGFKRITAIPKGFVSKKLNQKGEWTRVEFYSLQTGVSEGWIKTSLLSL